MLRMRVHVCVAAALLAAALCLDSARPAMAGPFVTSNASAGNGSMTEVTITGQRNESFSITYTDTTGATVVITTTVGTAAAGPRLGRCTDRRHLSFGLGEGFSGRRTWGVFEGADAAIRALRRRRRGLTDRAG